MKFSINLADYNSKKYGSGVDFKSLPHDELLLRIGAQLGAIEQVVDHHSWYHGIVIVRVVSCEKHPNADKLSVCRIDDGGVTEGVERGEDGLVQVVCGAPNVHVDMWAVWIPPNATVPSSVETDPFVLSARELRGVVSNGMLASPSELAVSDDHNGILEVTAEHTDHEPQAGEPVVDYFGLDDFVIDCENKMFTHRPDCFGNLGIAREVAAIFGMPFRSPDWYVQPVEIATDSTLAIQAQNTIGDLVPRFMVQPIEGVEVTKSPYWMQASLKRAGIRSINSIVDITNYYMHLTAQPTHAFDYDKLRAVVGAPDGEELVLAPRLAKEGETLELLNGKLLQLHTDDIVITCNDTVVALGGIMGGATTEVDDSTKNIVIECANFDMYTIRRSSMRHGLFTDAVTRFNKGQSPLQNDRVLAKMVQDICEGSSARAGAPVDLCNFSLDGSVLNHVEVHVDFINSRLGSLLSAHEMAKLLEYVECIVTIQDDVLAITVPFWRMDLAIAEDIVEEIGRLYGYDKLQAILPRRTATPAPINNRLAFQQTLRQTLTARGANELLTYSFVHGNLLKAGGVDPDQWAYHLRNALSPELQYYRTSLITSLAAKVHANIKAQAGDSRNEFALFEFGSAHVKGHFEEDEPKLPKQMRRLAFLYVADNKTARKYTGSAYYHAKLYLDLITNGQAIYEPLTTNEYPVIGCYQIGRSATVRINDQILGVIGEFRDSLTAALKLPEYCAGFELDIDLLLPLLKKKTYKPLSAYPSTSQDITFALEPSAQWIEVEQLLHAELAVAQGESGYTYELTPLAIFQESEKAKTMMSFRIKLSHPDKTLTTKEVSDLLETLQHAVATAYSARIQTPHE